MRIGLDVCGKVFDGIQLMTSPYEPPTKTIKIKPLHFWMPFEQSEVQISSVYVDVRFHIYKEGPGSFKRGPRSASAEPCGWMPIV